MSEWENLVVEVNEYLEATDDLSDAVVQVVKMNLQIGQDNLDERDSAMLSIKALLKGRDGTPFRKGNKAAVPASVRVVIDRVCAIYGEAITVFYGWNPLIPELLFRHGKSGGGKYGSEREYRMAELKRMRSRLVKMYKNGEWDGQIDSLYSHGEEE